MHWLAWWIVGLLCGGAAASVICMLRSRRGRAIQSAPPLPPLAAPQPDQRFAQNSSLTAGLAHEIKNPLSTIGLNLQLLAESIKDAQIDEPHAGRLQRRIDALTAEAEHLRGILEDFLRFAGRMELEREPTDLNRIVEEMIDFYSPQAEQSGVQLRMQLCEAMPEALVDRTLFKQAMLNLLINATQAMVQARYAEAPHGGAGELMVRTSHSPGGIEVHVIDTGPGIASENLTRIFEPYFSTKAGGSGLGLPTTRRIIQEHGGSLDVHTDLGKGSDFIIRLPI